MRLLAGDIGGTKTTLALFAPGETTPRVREIFSSRQFANLELLLEKFLEAHPEPVAGGCLGVAGPVAADRCEATNLPWVIDARILEDRFRIPALHLVNDFTALARGILDLPAGELGSIASGGADPRGPWIVVGAGTGLGEAAIIRTRDGYEILASEGGHTDFAPRNPLEDRLLQFGRSQFGRVSIERFVSGPGLHFLYRFLRDAERHSESTPMRTLLPTASAEEAPALIAQRALDGSDPLCVAALQLFVSLWGAEAGNLALKIIPRGGVYIAGGIAPKVLPALKGGAFMQAFLAKGRMRAVLQTLPVQAVLNPDAGLLGAAAIARTALGST